MARKNGPKQQLEVQQAQRRAKVADLYVRGHSQSTIAAILGVSQPTISRDVQDLQQEWSIKRVHTLDVHKARELQKLDEVERQAWGEWDLSKRVAETISETTGGPSARRTTKREQRGGDTRYLKIILECIVHRCELLGLYPDEWGEIDWSKLSDDQVRRIAEGEDPRSVLAESGGNGSLH